MWFKNPHPPSGLKHSFLQLLGVQFLSRVSLEKLLQVLESPDQDYVSWKCSPCSKIGQHRGGLVTVISFSHFPIFMTKLKDHLRSGGIRGGLCCSGMQFSLFLRLVVFFNSPTDVISESNKLLAYQSLQQSLFPREVHQQYSVLNVQICNSVFFFFTKTGK